MIGSGTLDIKRAFRIVGVFAPVSIVLSVLLGMIAVIQVSWAMWVVAGIGVLVDLAVGWVVFKTSSLPLRIAATLATPLVAAAGVWKLFYWLWPSMADANGGMSAVGFYAFVIVPWVALVGLGTWATIAGRERGSGPVLLWWLLGLVATAGAYPLIGWVTSIVPSDDMALLVVFFIPAFALCLWAGPSAILFVTALAARLRRPPADQAEPPSEVPAP